MKLSNQVLFNRKRKRMTKQEKAGALSSKQEKDETKRRTQNPLFQAFKLLEDDQKDTYTDLINYVFHELEKENLGYSSTDDEDELELQAVLLSSMTGKIYISEECQFFEMEKEDVKMKGIDKSCSVQKPLRFRSFSHNSSGESSCTFCVICDDAKPIALMRYNYDCGHNFCEDCIKKYVQESIQENVRATYCPESNCKKLLGHRLCESFLTEDMKILRSDTFHEMLALENEDGFICPFIDCCAFFYDDHKEFKIRACPHCWRLMCVLCKEPYS